MAPNINYNTKHLGTGDPLPPFTGKVRVYNMRYCPYAQRTILALNAKKIDYEVVNIDLKKKPEWLTSKSAFGKVPAVEIEENVCIYESLITVEYIDDVFPQRPLQSKDPARKALDKIIVESLTPVTTILFKLVRAPETVTDDVVSEYHKTLGFLQDQLKKRGTDFLGGSEPGYVDYMIWPWFERILALKGKLTNLNIPTDKFAFLLKYLDRMLKDPAVADYLVSGEVYKKFFDGYLKGGPFNYDTFHQN